MAKTKNEKPVEEFAGVDVEELKAILEQYEQDPASVSPLLVENAKSYLALMEAQDE